MSCVYDYARDRAIFSVKRALRDYSSLRAARDYSSTIAAAALLFQRSNGVFHSL